jgi:hypothetical protein
VSVLVDAAQLDQLVVMSGMAAINGAVLAKSIEEEDLGSAKIWGTVFGATSLIATWTFGRLM